MPPDPYDYILSKVERNSSKDRDDADYLFRTQKLDSQTLRERYQQELRPYLAKETWRKGPMEIVSGPDGKQKIHFEAPAAERVEPEMKKFLSWY